MQPRPTTPPPRDHPGPPPHLSHHPGGIAKDRHYTFLTIQKGLRRTAITLVSPSRGIAQDRHYTFLTTQEGLPRTAITLVSPSRGIAQDRHYTCLTIQEGLPRTAITLVSPSRRDCPGPPLHLSHHPGEIVQDRYYTCLSIQEGSPRTAIIPVSPSKLDHPTIPRACFPQSTECNSSKDLKKRSFKIIAKF